MGTTPDDRRNLRIQGLTPDGAGECAICLEPIPDGVAGVSVLVGRRGPELEPAACVQFCVTCCERIELAGKVATQIARLGRQKGTPSC